MRDRLNLMQQFCDQIKARFQGINLEYNETEMKFGDFCLHLAKLEATPKRLEMTSLLAELLKQADTQEVDKVVMLALGRLAPLYKDIDFGLAEKTIIRSLASAYNLETKTVVENFKKVGDLGIVASELKITRHCEERSDEAILKRDPSASLGMTLRVRLPRPTSSGLRGARNDGKREARESEISVNNVYQSLLEIATQIGEGSQEKKVNKTADLLRELDPLGAKYAVRIILGNLRLGFSDKTVLDALSVMTAGDKSAREKLEAAYNVRPDIGWIAKKIQNSEFRIQNLRPKPELGVPILPALCQRLPAAEEIITKMKKVAVEPKWDGQRIQAHGWILRKKDKGKRQKEIQKTIVIKLFTRSLEDVTEMFPDLVEALSVIPAKAGIYINRSRIPPSLTVRLQELSVHGSRSAIRRAGKSGMTSFILDGEVVGIDPATGRVLPFQTMITRKRKYGIAEKLAAVPIKYMVFDILYLNDKSLMNEEFTKRRQVLERTVLGRSQGQSSLNTIVQVAPQIVTSSPGEIRKFLKQQIDSGLEGIVAKRTDAPYIPGRTQFAWVKLKWEGAAKSGGLLDTVDCVVMGTYAGRGKRAGFGVGAFLVGILSGPSGPSYPSFLTISKIGTGLTDEQWRELRAKGQGLRAKGKPKEYDVPKELTPDIWLRPELVVEIQADNITKSPLHTAGFALRFPRLVRYRSDKRPEQATTVEEVKKLYRISLRKPRLPPR